MSLPAPRETCTLPRRGGARRGGAGRGGGCGPAERYGAVVDNAARLTVIGSLNMDISVSVASLPVPGATVLGGAAAFAPGGKGANQAVAAARLGAGAGLSVRMVGCVGDDDFGRTLRATLRAEGVDDGAVRTVAGVPTGIAMITVDQAGENTITVAPGANREVGAGEVAEARESAAEVLVISAEVPVPVIRAALDGSFVNGAALRVLNLAPAPPEAAELVAAHPDWLVVNESEAAAVLGRPVAGLAEAARAAADLVAAGARNAVVTAGAAGAAYCGPRDAAEAEVGVGAAGVRTAEARVGAEAEAGTAGERTAEAGAGAEAEAGTADANTAEPGAGAEAEAGTAGARTAEAEVGTAEAEVGAGTAGARTAEAGAGAEAGTAGARTAEAGAEAEVGTAGASTAEAGVGTAGANPADAEAGDDNNADDNNADDNNADDNNAADNEAPDNEADGARARATAHACSDGRQPRGGGRYTLVTVPGFKVRAVDSVGAGDTFVGALAVALAAGVGPAAAVTAAVAAGATAATRAGTQSGMPGPADILAATAYPWPVPPSE